MNNGKIVPEIADKEEIANLNDQIKFDSEPNKLEISSDLNVESDMQCKELPDFEQTLRNRTINIWSEMLDDENSDEPVNSARIFKILSGKMRAYFGSLD